MEEPEKITIIEGPPPAFEHAGETWLLGLTESTTPADIALCRLRTFNGPALVERCVRSWRSGHPIHLEYRSEDGLTSHAPILAARWTELSEGQVLLLWVRMPDDGIEVEIDYEADDLGDEADGEADGSDFDPLL
jgi:hypothetical protein